MSDFDVFGKLLPNLKVSIGDDLSISENSLEAGEIEESDINLKQPDGEPVKKEKGPEITKTEIIRKWMQTLQNPRVYSTNFGEFQTGLDLTSEVLIKKLERRAERFGLDEQNRKQITQREIDLLYKSFGLDPANLTSNKNVRLGVIHMRGVNDMNTKEVSEYFKDYAPSSVEWINDTSCNVCWFDETGAARAMLGVSQPFVIKRRSKREEEKGEYESEDENKESPADETVIEMSDSEDEETDVAAEKTETDAGCEMMDVDKKVNDSVKDIKSFPVDIPVPPGCWRLGMPHKKAKDILLRFATIDDKKIRGAEKRSQYYMKYGNPNYGGLKGLISNSRKRKLQNARNRQVVENFSNDFEQEPNEDLHFSTDHPKRSKVPRMKMYADEEEERKRNKKKLISNFREKNHTRSIKSRLGPRYTKDELFQIGPKASDDDDDESLEQETFSVTCKIPSRFNIWADQARQMAKEEDELEEESFTSNQESPRYTSHRFERKSYQRNRQNSYNNHSGDLREALRNSSRQKKDYDYADDLREALHDSSRKKKDYDYDDDLREALRSSSQRTNAPKKDLRSKIVQLKDDKPMKHRSPLCRDSD